MIKEQKPLTIQNQGFTLNKSILYKFKYQVSRSYIKIEKINGGFELKEWFGNVIVSKPDQQSTIETIDRRMQNTSQNAGNELLMEVAELILQNPSQITENMIFFPLNMNTRAYSQ
jgi:hypothetical protein